MQKKSGIKVELKKNVQICTNCDTLSNHSNLFLISAKILMIATFFFNPKHFLSSEQVRDLQQRFSARYYISFEYNSRGSEKVL